MRHSFLPIPEQNALKRVYRVHVAVIALFLLSVVGLIGIGSLFPAYMSARGEEKSQLSLAATIKQSQDSNEASRIQKELQTDNARIKTLATGVGSIRSTSIIESIVGARGSVKFSSLSIIEMSSSTATVAIQGVAPTRESLVALKTRLDDLSPGNKTELPISGFAKSKDLAFSIKLVYKLP